MNKYRPPFTKTTLIFTTKSIQQLGSNFRFAFLMKLEHLVVKWRKSKTKVPHAWDTGWFDMEWPINNNNKILQVATTLFSRLILRNK